MRALILALLLAPSISLACTPPVNYDKLTTEQQMKWLEANPCEMDVDIEKYNVIKHSCAAKHITSADVEELCNHEAYEGAKKPASVPNPDYKPAKETK